MNKCIKYLAAINIVNVAEQIASYFVTPRDLSADIEFESLFNWTTLLKGFEEARVVKKPIFLYIYKPLCPACLKLKRKFAKSIRLMDLSDRFVMIKAEMNVEEGLNKKKFQPDGKYVPRILFFSSDGDLIWEAYNEHPEADKEHKYFYSSPAQIVDTMLYVLKKYTDEPLKLIYRSELPLSPETCDSDNDTFGPTLID